MTEREIKFRVWSKKDKEFYITKLDEYGETRDGFSIKGYASSDGYEVLQQYTGLLDSKNKEIYEGDIVIVQDPYHYIPEQKTTVIFENGAWAFICVDSDGNKMLSWLYGTDMVTVIGNIFENKDLL